MDSGEEKACAAQRRERHIKNTLAANLKQAVYSYGFLAAALGAALILLLASVESFFFAFRMDGLLTFGYHTELLLAALKSSAITLALPILCALPYTAAFVDDLKSGFYKQYLPRTTMGRYVWGKVIACALAGALALVVGILLSWGILALVLLPKEAAPVVYVSTAGETVRQAASPIWGKLLLYGFSAAFWSLVGMLFATLTNSKYMAYASPFVLYYVLIILNERYFSLYVIYPREWLEPSALWQFGNAGALTVVGELIVAAALAAAIAAKRRLRSL